jgi:hypothetical protein
MKKLDYFDENLGDNGGYTQPPLESWHFTKEISKDRKKITKEILNEEKGDPFLLFKVLSKNECEHLINETEKIGYEKDLGYNKNYRYF